MVTTASFAIQIDELRANRGKTEILHGVNLNIPAEKVVGLLGPSGCGKTTLLRSIVGVQAVASGKVTVLGSAAGSSNLRHRIGYVSQSASVYDDLTVRQNLSYFRKILGAPKRDVDHVLDVTDLSSHASQLVSSLSGGQRSRVSLAAALLGDPELLILDEPTVGLDPVLRVKLWELFHTLAAQGTSLLVSSHVMDEAIRCDSLLLMRDGEILAEGTPASLRKATGATDTEGAFLAMIAQHPRKNQKETAVRTAEHKEAKP